MHLLELTNYNSLLKENSHYFLKKLGQIIAEHCWHRYVSPTYHSILALASGGRRHYCSQHLTKMVASFPDRDSLRGGPGSTGSKTPGIDPLDRQYITTSEMVIAEGSEPSLFNRPYRSTLSYSRPIEQS